VVEGRLQLVWVRLEAGVLSLSSAWSMQIVGGPMGDQARRVVAPADTSGAGGVASPEDVAVVFGRALARLVGAPLAPGGERGARWEVAYPALPPEAEIRDVEAHRGSWWLATTSGLLRGERPAGPYRRATPPAGSRAMTAVAVGASRMFAASASELLAGEASPTPVARVVSASRMPRDPALSRVHTRALVMLRLEPRRGDALWRGLGRRGWWPTLTLHGGADYRSGRSHDYDENFSYGQLNQLNDENREHSTDYDAGIVLSWDLGELAYDDDAVELSREMRQVISLRDNVLDEINQLYFDRQRALRALSGFADWSDPEAAALRLRALELAAGLDGWTGGWFSSQVEIPPAAKVDWQRPQAPADAIFARPPAPAVHPETAVPTVERRHKEERENS
jgi:hypothetical protein